MNLAPIKARLAAATPGPWQVVTDTHPHYAGGHHTERRIFTTWEHGQLKDCCPVVNGSVGLGAVESGPPRPMVRISAEDADLMASAPTDLAALIAEVERLTNELKAKAVAGREAVIRE